MANSARSAARGSFLPADFTAALGRRAVQLGGLIVAAAGLAVAVALLTYHSTDPSLNRAVAGAAHNLLGLPGAYAADLLLQSLGISSALIALALMLWGWRLAGGGSVAPFWLRLTLLPIAILAAAIALSAVTPPGGWPLRSGLGGVTGTLLLASIKTGLGTAGVPVGAGLIGIVAAVIMLLTVTPALTLTWRDWKAAAGLASRGAAKSVTVAAGLTGRAAGHGFSIWRRRSWSLPSFRRTPVEEPLEKPARRPRVEPQLRQPAEDEDEAEETPPARRAPAARKLVASRPQRAAPGKREAAERQPTLVLGADDDYALPDLNLLTAPKPLKGNLGALDEAALARNAQLLESVLEDFSVRGAVVKIHPGPVVTLYEFEPAPGIKTSRVINLSDDIARSMSAVSVRVAVIPGRNVIGIELPNARREMVYLRELLASEMFEKSAAKLALVAGKDIGGAPIIVDLARMPHLLIAGTTGSGKSVAINTMILSLLYRLTPDQCKFIMIDPKMLELSVYDGIPQLLTPVVTDAKKAVVALKWAVREMEDRYQAMSKLGVRNIEGYNARLAEARRSGEELHRRVQTGFDPETGQAIYEDQPLALDALPYIVVIVDEMADLMLVAGKDLEGAVQRLAQMARAAGIHLIMATQRPSVDVITGTIKANFPTRISFQVTSKIDSRTILGEQGAEQLLGQGDMLYMAGGGRITRVHGPFVSDAEVEQVVRFLKTQ
ncbi:MAG TPA: DNA translocase FtsK 4TM domain-containing protein, partial [Alphaproteobacteria bacterium]|nr:DNA translocase FtsK 4TM domain-containing protein [Alphaproteobacteria bacterium]